MGAQLRVYRQKIKSAQTTKKITRAMELIAASRIQKAQQRVADQLGLVLDAAKQRQAVPDHVLLSGPPGLGKTTLAMIVAAWLGAPWFGRLGLEPIYAMAAGVMAGGVLQLAVQVPALKRLGLLPRIGLGWARVREKLRQR